MAKKAKRKLQRGQKVNRASSSLQKTSAEPNVPAKTETVECNVAGKEKNCLHFDNGIDLATVTSKISSAEHIRCEDCKVGVSEKRVNKGKQGRKKGGSTVDSKTQSKTIWVCLECGSFHCGGIGFPTVPQSHAVRHAKQTRHQLAIQYENLRLRWCFPCNTLIPVEKSTESGGSNDPLSDIVKVIKGRSTEKVSVNVEDVWFGSGSILGEMKTESTSFGLVGTSGYLVRGLVNLGNTCFFNSILQNLLAIDRLRNHYLELNESVGPLTVSLKKICIETVSASGLRNSINPRTFFGSICSKAPQFRGFQQHDSHELLRCLLDGLCTEELIAKKRISPENGTSANQGPTFIDATFGGQLSSTVSCLDCGHSSKVLEPFLDLSLPVPTKRPPSKKANKPISRAKKQKLPSKRNGRYRPKVSKDGSPSASPSAPSSSVNGELFAKQPGDALDNSLGLSVVTATKIAGSLNERAVNEFRKDQLLESITDDSSWLDYLEPDFLSNDNDTTSRCNDIAKYPDTGVKDDGQTNESAQDVIESSNQVLESTVTTTGSEAGFVSNDNDTASKCNDIASYPDIGVKDDGQTNESVQDGIESSNQLLESTVTTTSSVVGFVSDDKDMASKCNDIASYCDAGEKVDGQKNKSLHDGVESSCQILEGTVPTTGSSENLTRLDVSERSEVEYDHHIVSEVNDGSVHKDSRGEIIQSASGTHCERAESNFSPGNCFEDDKPLQVQGSEVILLPYKEDTFSNGAILFVEGEVSSSAVGCDPESLGFEGFGDLFNEPEIVEGPSVKPMSSESDPDEVDNSNSQVSVESCLAYFIKPELLSSSEHGWNCENCSKVLQEQRRQLKKMHQKASDIIDQNVVKDRVNDNPPSSGVYSSCPSEVQNPSNGVITEVVSCKVDDDKENREEINLILEDSKFRKSNVGRTQFPSVENVGGISNVACSGNDSTIAACSTNEVQHNESSGGSESEGNGDEKMNSESVKVKRDATKSIFINKAPSILTIHLKRFCQDGRGRLSKLNGHVDFKDTIDLTPYMEPRCKEMDEYKYRLSGVVEHSGSMRGGHYIAYIRGGSKKSQDGDNSLWYHTSDSHVRQCSFQEVLNSEAYILFYEKV